MLIVKNNNANIADCLAKMRIALCNSRKKEIESVSNGAADHCKTKLNVSDEENNSN